VGVKFEEVVQANYVPYFLSWTYKFDQHSFPKGSVDDHIEMVESILIYLKRIIN
jgi:hypothetical protein